MFKYVTPKQAKTNLSLALSIIFVSTNLLACSGDKDNSSINHSTQSVYNDATYFRANVVSLKAAKEASEAEEAEANEEATSSKSTEEISTELAATIANNEVASSSSTNSLAYRASISSFTFDEDAYNSLDKTASAYIENFSVINQNPSLPTGCEVTSLTMVLNYYGNDITNTELASNYLNTGSLGSNPYVNFVGSPFSSSAYGCYSPVIVDCATSFGANAVNISYCSYSELLNYVSEGYPVIVWGTMGMTATRYGSSSWTDSEGNTVIWRGNEHCLVLVGYDVSADIAYLADPLTGEIESYNLKTFLQRWVEQDSQAVLVY